MVASLSLVLSLAIMFGYVMTEVRHPAFLARVPAGMMEMLDALPGWALAARACGIAASLAGAALLFMRSRHAYTAFLVIVLALAIGTSGEQSLALPDTMRSSGMIATKLANWGIALAFLTYAHWMRIRSVLI